jgi:hypothetical protein
MTQTAIADPELCKFFAEEACAGTECPCSAWLEREKKKDDDKK